MAGKILITAETGSDMTKELAAELGVVLIPMHVSLGDTTLDDGTFPPEDVCAYYDKTGKAPTTSGSTPYDFEKVLEEIFTADPDARVLYLAYSAVTTCSYHRCELALATEALPYLLYTEALTGMDTGKAAITVAIEPIVAGLIGICFFEEWKTMDWIKGLGMVLVIGSVIVLNRPEKQKAK